MTVYLHGKGYVYVMCTRYHLCVLVCINLQLCSFPLFIRGNTPFLILLLLDRELSGAKVFLIIKIFANYIMKNILTPKFNLIIMPSHSQVRDRCRSEWAEFQDRLAEADKKYLARTRTG